MSAQHQLQQMTADDQQIWWSAQAQQALAAFGIQGATCEWMGYTHNAVFAVETAGTRAVLRLKIIEGDQITGEQAEAHFLRQLHAETDLIAPFPLKDLLLLDVVLPDGSAAIISAVLFAFIEGTTPQPDTVTLETMQQIGRYLAALHTYGQLHHHPQQTGCAITDSRYALLRKTPQFPPPPHHASFYELNSQTEMLFSADQRDVLAAVAERIQHTMTALGTNREVFGVIHGDMLLKNVIVTADGLGALDFEYFGWGYHVYDLTPVLWQLQPFADYANRKQALLAGYTEVRSLNEQERDALETFIAARQAASMRWIIANRNNPHVAGKVDAILEQRSEELRTFLRTGQLRRT